MNQIEKIIYFGTAPIAVPALQALHAEAGCEVIAVCTQPDRPSGRKRRLSPSAVKVCAQNLGIQVFDPEKISADKDPLAALQADLAVVFAYGQYLPKSVFELPAQGAINFHPSLLPKYRGASPIQSSLLDGVVESGLSVLKVSERMDAGDILLQHPLQIRPEDNSETLHERFARLAAELVPDLIRGLRDGTLIPRPQDETQVLECGKISKQDGAIQWTDPAQTLLNRIRAYQPWPGSYFPLGELGNLKVLAAEVVSAQGPPGTVLEVSGNGPVVACGREALRLIRVQPPGKNAMDGKSFLNGYSLQAGSVLLSADPS